MSCNYFTYEDLIGDGENEGRLSWAIYRFRLKKWIEFRSIGLRREKLRHDHNVGVWACIVGVDIFGEQHMLMDVWCGMKGEHYRTIENVLNRACLDIGMV